jgi:phosphoglycerate dehydrogenase-like enzyme
MRVAILDDIHHAYEGTSGNVVLTPHLGWPTDEAYERFADAAADVLLAYLDGRDVPRFQ